MNVTQTSQKRVGVMGTLVTAILAFSWLATNWLQLVTFNLPHREMEIPVLWWAIFGAYSLCACSVFGYRRESLRPLLVDALLLHLQWRLVQFWLDFPIRREIGSMYAIYPYVVIAVFTIVTSVRAGRIARKLLSRSLNPEAVLRIPFALGSIVAFAYAAWRRDPVLVGCGVIGLVVGYWSWNRLRDTLRQIRNRLMLEQRPKVAVTVLAAVVLFAFAFRVAWYVHLVHTVGFSESTGFLVASDDGKVYHGMAVEIAREPLKALLNGSVGAVSTIFDPLYPILLGLWYRLFGIQITPAVIIQAALGSLLLIPIYAMGCKLGGGSKAAGLLSAGGVALSQPLIFSSAVYGIEALYIPALVSWSWLAWEWLEGNDRKSTLFLLAVSGGVILGLRRFAPLMIVATLIAVVFLADRSLTWRRVKQAALVLLLCGVVYSPIEIMFIEKGETRLIPRMGGKVVNGSLYWDARPMYPDIIPSNESLTQLGINPLTDLPGTIRNSLAHPVAVAAALGYIIPRRIVAFFFWHSFGAFDTFLFVNPTIPNPFTGAAEFYLAVAVVCGVFGALRERSSRRLAVLLLVIIGVQTFVHSILLFTQTIRYSTPVRPHLIAFAAATVALILRQFREGPDAEREGNLKDPDPAVRLPKVYSS